MSNEMTPLEAMAEAVRLLRDAADELHESHNAPGETTFDGEPEAQAAYEEHERVANALESAIAARLRGEAAPEVEVDPRMASMMEHGMASWCATPQPAASAPVAGWLQAVDTELVNAHLGVANADDDFETARRKLSELIQWHIDVSHDPRVNGAPVAGDAVAALPAKWRADAEARDEDGIYWQGHSQRMHMQSAADELDAALAQDRASQAGGVDTSTNEAWIARAESKLATQPPAVGVDVSDEMVERAALAYEAEVDGEVYSDDVPRIAMRAALTAALRTGGGAS